MTGQEGEEEATMPWELVVRGVGWTAVLLGLLVGPALAAWYLVDRRRVRRRVDHVGEDEYESHQWSGHP